MTYKFRITGVPTYNADSDGLKFRRYSGYPVSVPGSDVTPSPNPYGLSASAWTGESGTNTAINISITSSATVYVWRGYFKPDASSDSWQFRTRSNDGSWLWVDTDAEVATTALVPEDANVKNGGTHPDTTQASANIALSQSADDTTYYAISVVAGNDPGSGMIRVEFRRDSGDWQSDGDGFYFHDSRRDDGFYPE